MESYPPSDDGTMNSKVDYTTYWELRALPFDNVPDPRFYVPCLQHDAAHRWLSYGIQTRKGMLLLTGDIGCGKTLLSRRLIVGLSTAQYDIALVANPALSPSELLDEVLSQFGLGLVGSKAARLQTLNERLELNEQRGISSVLVVDEAQAIESVNGFEELRLLTNFQLNDRFLLTVVLIGQPELRLRIAGIHQLNQRIAVRAHLGPFTAEETTAYITARMGAATHRTDVFTKEAMAIIYEQSKGIGRLINALCDQCLFAGAIEQVSQIDDRLVQRVGQIKGTPMPAVKSIEKAIESIEPNQNTRVSDEQLETYRQAVARLKPLEEELRVERDRATHSTQRVVQLEGQLGRVKELELMLAGEREQTAQLKTKLAEVGSATARLQELESLLKIERERTAEAKNRASVAESLGERMEELETALQKERAGSVQQIMRLAELQKNVSHVQELEATLHVERQAATQLVQQMTAMEKAVTRSQDLVQQLAKEQDRASDLTRRAAEGEQVAARVSRLEQDLVAEKEKSKDLAARLPEAERASQRAQVLESLLQMERELKTYWRGAYLKLNEHPS